MTERTNYYFAKTTCHGCGWMCFDLYRGYANLNPNRYEWWVDELELQKKGDKHTKGESILCQECWSSFLVTSQADDMENNLSLEYLESDQLDPAVRSVGTDY